MTHSDDDGLVLPPKLAPMQVVIVPIPKPAGAGRSRREDLPPHLTRQRHPRENRQRRPEPARLQVRRIRNDRHARAPRPRACATWTPARWKWPAATRRRKANVPLDGIADHVANLLDEIQQNLFDRAKAYRDAHITRVDTWAELEDVLENKGGFVSAHWDGTTETELAIKEKTKATIRCIPLGWPEEAGQCILTGQPSERRVLFARAY